MQFTTECVELGQCDYDKKKVDMIHYLAADNVVLHEDCPEVGGQAVDSSVSNVAHESCLTRPVRAEQPIPDQNDKKEERSNQAKKEAMRKRG